MKVKDWNGVEFESNSYRTKQYIAFEKDCKAELKRMIKRCNAELVQFHPMHFEWTAVVKRNGVYLYIKVGDVRYCDWYNEVLIRYVKDENDYHGESNNNTTWKWLENKMEQMFSWREGSI